MAFTKEGAPTMSPTQIYEVIEEVLADYGYKRFDALVNANSIDNDTLRDERAKARAAKEILSKLRATLGYTID